jgi:arylformamidase
MRVVDLSHALSAAMPVYPGTPQPLFQPATTFEQEGFCETWLSLGSHSGTHLDAPAHMIPGGAALDELPAAVFVGPGLIVDVAAFAGGEIPLAHFDPWREQLAQCGFLLLRSGHDRHWGNEAYFHNYPLLSAAAAAYLAALPNLQGIGLDMISIDAADSTAYPNHNIILGAGKLVVENLTNLSEIGGAPFLLSVLPLNYPHADGSPVRAVAIELP